LGGKGFRENEGIGKEEMIGRRRHTINYGLFIKFAIFSTMLFMTLALTGCGYTTRSMISNKYRTIYIAPFLNKIDITRDTDTANKYKLYRPKLETDVTRKVVDKYLFDGNLRPVNSETADLILKGEVVDFRKDPLRYTESDEVKEYRVSISVNITLWDQKEQKMLWQEGNFTGDNTYFTQGALSKSEATAVNDAINDLARRIVERTVEQW
jgi:outer membrane lipopolysaccharide assembly protein LptE/RlpB